MTVEFKLPELGENIEEAEVAQVLVKVGDVVEPEQAVMELETEKAVVELPCPYAGRIEKIHVSEGDAVKVGAVVLTIEEDGQATSEKEPEKEEVTEKTTAGQEREEAKREQPTAGAPPKKEAAAREEREAELKAAETVSAEEKQDGPPPPAGPATRLLARKLGVDLHKVRGSGPQGRITQEDVEAFVRNLTSSATVSAGGGFTEPALPDFEQFGPVERQRVNKLNRTAAQQLSTSWRTIPHVTQHDLADVTELDAARKSFMQSAGKGGPKVTMTSIAVKAAAQLLEELPQFNSSFDAAAGELVLKKYVHIGVAVDTEHGLVVPVIRDADEKTLIEISAELIDLAEKARNRKLELAEMQGATFTITNLGGIGGTAFTPIVNFPEVAILGLSRTQSQVRMHNGQPQERLMLPLSLSYDHRVINGADAARFVVRLAQTLHDPFAMLANL